MNSSAAIIPLLLIVFPLAMAGGCVVLRGAPRMILGAGLATLAVECALALSTPLERSARLLGAGVSYDGLGRMLLLVACTGAFLATVAAAASEHGPYFIATELFIISCIAAIAVASEPLAAPGLLLLGGLVAAVQLADRPAGSAGPIGPRTRSIALRYTVLIALSGLVMLLGAVAISSFGPGPAAGGPVPQRIGFGMLVFGYAVRCGLLPFQLWFRDIVEDAPPSTVALHGGLLTALALPVLLDALGTQPELLADNETGRRLLVGLGAISALAGGALGIDKGARRSLAYLAIANLGLLTIGLGTGSVPGMEAALLGAAGHVLGIGLAALGLALLEHRLPGGHAAGAVYGRQIGALALVVGVLLLVGVPPFAGFAPKLLLLAAAWRDGPLSGVLVVAAVTLMALAAGRLLSDALQPRAAHATPGTADEQEQHGGRAIPRTSSWLPAVCVLLCLAATGAGLWPLPLAAQVNEVVRSFPFLAP